MPETSLEPRSDGLAGRLWRLRGTPPAVAGALFGTLLLVYLVSTLAGSDPRLYDASRSLGPGSVLRLNVLTLALLAYTVGAGLLEFQIAPNELAELRGLLGCDDAHFEAAVARALPGRATIALTCAGGALFGASIPLVSWLAACGLDRPWPWNLHDAWNLALMMLLFGSMGIFALWGIRFSRLYSSLARRHARVQLLDPTGLRLFARRGLRHALYWFVGSGLALLLIIDAAQRGVVLAVIGGTVALGVSALLLPALGIHERLVCAKADELVRVRRELERRRAALFGEGEGEASELPALLAYESRIEAVREWPFDTPLLIRFGLLILIPLGSWLGGALVERIVDRALG